MKNNKPNFFLKYNISIFLNKIDSIYQSYFCFIIGENR